MSNASDLEIASLAKRLRVDEAALRASLDATLPDPKLDVLVAVVREFGVDPTWLLTGVYAAGTHHRALDADEVGIRAMLKELVRREPAAADRSVAESEPPLSA